MSQSRFDPSKTKPIVTVQQHILEEQRRLYPGASGEFSWLLSGITLATKMIEAKVRRAGLSDIIGAVDRSNVQGEIQQKLDVYANEVLIHCLGIRENVGVLVSEEDAQPLPIPRNVASAKYVVVFDPLDGSSNIDVNVSVGTIFSILRCPAAGACAAESVVLQSGARQVAAGYVLYGSSTVLVYTTGSGVHGFTLDPAIGAYVLSHPDLRIPERGKYYSVNEGYSAAFPQRYRNYLECLKDTRAGRQYAARYIGSLVADFHRTLLKGGIFLYPPTVEQRSGKLRLLYEANPIAFIAEQAGGAASDGERRILDVEPRSIHQRTPLVVGGQYEMNLFAQTH